MLTKRFDVTLVLAITFSLLSFASITSAQDKMTLTEDQLELVNWRSIGPANMGGRITSIAVYEKDPCMWWAASASGGLLKTTNNGVTFEHQFDDQATVSIGDVQVAQSDPNIVWVGTGEANPRNSVSWGDGVYKSTDGGKTWTNMGLNKIFQTGRIAIHPENPDIVYVGALGRLWGPNEDRGLYKTTDGGKTWNKILYIDDKTGVIDVQMNMKNPEQLVVATYERMRDGFDGNDPIKKYGEGSGIYVTKDGGESFTKCADGLPTCKLGRVGLSIYRKDPKYIYAIVESEKIAKEPDDAALAGIQGADETIGARITRVTEGGAADKAGVKVDDIVVQIDGELIHGYRELQSAIRKSKAGQKVDWTISRDQKEVEVEVTYAAKTNGEQSGARRGRSRNPFTGTLGGQAANLQDQQGEKGFEYGGIYMSKNFGKSWTRINTLNPRPMYYSQIRVDPSDKNFIYVCGTSLYKSKDGGKTFTGDGGTDGIHVDHHAMYVDPRDGRHIILGNDGGIYITWDRMEHWDHHNHFAIGQFYHVGVGPNEDYHVYGGLQDNGSWGGPVRAKDGSLVNSDWYRVGGGDGFITLVDPTDKDQIYSESQNGAMSTMNMRTGERAFMRPRAPRGTRYRFNWKTPFVLSPHNPKIHYSAGNHVFKTAYKGRGMKAISPEITNTDKGAGSAISESPVEQGVIYVGTTDGAVWMTRNDGKDWEPIFVSKEEKDEEQKEEAKSDSAEKPEAKKDTDKAKSDSKDPVTGAWEIEFTAGEGGRGPRTQMLNLELQSDNKVTGSSESRRGETELTDGKFDPETGKITFEIATERFTRSYEGKVSGNSIEGKMKIAFGEREMEMDFSGKKDPGNSLALATLNQVLVYTPSDDDPVSGTWEGNILSDQLPSGGISVTVELKMDKDGVITGKLSAPDAPGDGEMGIVEGSYKASDKTIYFYAENDDVELDAEGKLDGKKMKGNVLVNGQMKLEFSVEMTKGTAKPDATEETQAEEQASPSDEKAEPAKEEAVVIKDDPVAGKWQGEFISENMPAGSSQLTVNLKRNAKGKIVGDYETQRGEGEISEGTFDKEKSTLNLFAESENFSLEFDGKVSGDSYKGTVDFGGGRFQIDFELKRVSKATAAAPETASTKEEEKTSSLGSLVPGPRWVSSLEASRHEKGRVYITLDGHRSNDDKPYVFVSEDYGKNWTSILANIPESVGSSRVIREDLENENILYLGCEFSSWVSIDRGQSWTKFNGLPTVSVHEIAQHPTNGDIVAGTHGRSLWVANVSSLRQLTSENLNSPVALLKPQKVIRWRSGQGRGASGTRRFVGERTPRNANIVYHLKNDAREASLSIIDARGTKVADLEAKTDKGLHMVEWDMRRQGRGGRGGASSQAGSFTVLLTVDGNEQRQVLTVERDPTLSADAVEMDEQLEWWLEMAEGEDD